MIKGRRISAYIYVWTRIIPSFVIPIQLGSIDQPYWTLQKVLSFSSLPARDVLILSCHSIVAVPFLMSHIVATIGCDLSADWEYLWDETLYYSQAAFFICSENCAANRTLLTPKS